MENELIPENRSGMETNTESTAECRDEAEAKEFFSLVRQRLLHVNGWHELAGTGTADFALTDSSGNEVARNAQQGDHFRIDIPGPGPATGDGYDWVQVEAVEEEHNGDNECVAIRVRPATNPLNEKTDVAHFFTDDATSSFIVKRESNRITAGVYGRNEKPNTKADTVTDKLRNAAVGTGAITGFSKLQWKSLVNGLVKKAASD
jgi:hypothetical protein